MASVVLEKPDSIELIDPAGVRLRPGYIGGEAKPLFAWLHEPVRQQYDTGVVICPPLGYEYTHSYRSLRKLANSLAEAGLPTIRFDYFGTGESVGDHTSPGLAEHWPQDVNEATWALKKATGVTRVILIGVRAGATIAAKAAAEHGVCALGFWAPISRGRRWVRELKAVSATAQSGPEIDDGILEAGGFQFTKETLASISAWEIADMPFPDIEDVLIIERDDLVAEDGLVELLEKKGLNLVRHCLPGYPEMMAEPHYTEIPDEFIAATKNWAISLSAPGSGTGEGWCVPRHALTSPEMMDRLILANGPRPIFGILSVPGNGMPQEKPLVVLSNSGAVHHVGPNRLYVELARRLANEGYASLRIDLGNLGDSVIGTPDRLNHPYPREAVNDLSAVVNEARRQLGNRRIVLAGLCSGSHTSFHAAAAEKIEGIDQLIMINPLTFFYREGMSLATPSENRTSTDAAYYRGVIKQRDRWLKMLKGQADVGYIIGYVGRRIREKAHQSGASLLERYGLRAPSALSSQLQQIIDRGIAVTMIVADTDPGENILMNNGGFGVQRMVRDGEISIRHISHADHTFSRRIPRREFINLFLENLCHASTALRTTA